MPKTVLVVCNHGNTSQFVCSSLEAEMAHEGNPEEFDVLARGVLGKLPTEHEFEKAAAVVAPYDAARIQELRGQKVDQSFFKAWIDFFDRAKQAGKTWVPYYDFKKRAFLDAKIVLGKLRKEIASK